MAERFCEEVGWSVNKVIPFSSATKWTGVVFEEEGGFLVGAPEFIMGARYQEISQEVAVWGQRGYRVLLLAAYDGRRSRRIFRRMRSILLRWSL